MDVCLWRLEDNLQELILSYYVSFGDQTQVVRLGSKHPYQLKPSHQPLLRFIHKNRIPTQIVRTVTSKMPAC